MKKLIELLKEDFRELMGSISIEEIITNQELIRRLILTQFALREVENETC